MGFHTYARMLRAAHGRGHLGGRHAAAVTGMLGLRAGLGAVVAGARRVDDVVSPGWRRSSVRTPVWIVAAPRSGTTWMHRLMALDTERFTSMTLGETVLPSVTLQRAVSAVSTADAAFGGVGEGLLRRAEKRLFAGWDGVHALGLDRPEEDEALFVYAGASPAFWLLSPFVDAPAWRSVDGLPARERERIMRFHRGCLQRHLHGAGAGRTLLLKNTLAAARLEALLETFPDARFVHLVRHPYETIPSILSMFHVVWRAHLPHLAKDAPEVQAFGRRMMASCRQYADLERRLPADRVVTVRYPDLVADPVAAVERVYDHLGLRPSSAFRRRLVEEARRARSHRSTHRYRLEDFGLSRRDVDRELGDLIARYSLDTSARAIRSSRMRSTRRA